MSEFEKWKKYNIELLQSIVSNENQLIAKIEMMESEEDQAPMFHVMLTVGEQSEVRTTQSSSMKPQDLYFILQELCLKLISSVKHDKK